MEKFLTDMHTHSTASHDGQNTPAEMLEKAQQIGVAFYGFSEHFDYDYDVEKLAPGQYKAPTTAQEEDIAIRARTSLFLISSKPQSARSIFALRADISGTA